MTEELAEVLSPEWCSGKILEISGAMFDPYTAIGLWPRILQHKWLMSEKFRPGCGLPRCMH